MLVFVAMTLALCVLYGCANQGLPTGGPKDVTPPVALSFSPPNGTTNFNGNEFYVEFDEYVTIKDQDGILVSPPMNPKPIYSTKGRGVAVKLRDTLLPNTTYLFQFRNAIADFNEGNPLPCTEYVFSTGNLLDTFCLGGMVKDALSDTPSEETITVLLYDAATFTDSSVLGAAPSYTTRCDKAGYFMFNYIRPGGYRILALEDGDKNLKLGNNEAVAFCDSVVHSYYEAPPTPRDTTLPDSAWHIVDSIQKADRGPRLQKHTLRLSSPVTDIQRVTSHTMPRKAYAAIITQLPMTKPRLHNLYSDSIVWQLNSTRDTLQVWALTPTLDTMMLTLHDASGVNDTLKLRYRHVKNKVEQLESEPSTTSKRSLENLKAPPMLSTNATGKFNYFDTLWLQCGIPVKEIVAPQQQWQYGLSEGDTNARGGYIIIRNLTDSTEQRCWTQLYGSRLKAIVHLSGDTALPSLQQGKKYQLVVLPRLLTDIYGHSNDSLISSFEVNSANAFSSIMLEVTVQNASDFIFQLLGSKDKVVREQIVREAQCTKERITIAFPNVTPGTYRIRAIEDVNHNAKWDACNYWQHTQPERVFYLDKSMELRANWEVNEKFSIENFSNEQ